MNYVVKILVWTVQFIKFRSQLDLCFWHPVLVSGLVSGFFILFLIIVALDCILSLRKVLDYYFVKYISATAALYFKRVIIIEWRRLVFCLNYYHP